jgi:hypothetical protein
LRVRRRSILHERLERLIQSAQTFAPSSGPPKNRNADVAQEPQTQ